MSWITACAKLNGNKTQIRVSVINRPLVRGGHTCINWSRFDTEMLQCSFFFLISHSWRVSYIIYPSLDHLDSTFVDHLSLHLSVYPIRHPL